MQNLDGDLTTDVKQWSAALHAHCSKKYSRTGDDTHDDLLRFLNEQVHREVDEAKRPQWTWAVTLQARVALSRAKSTGRSAISAEVLQSLSADAVHALHDMLRAHFEHDDPPPLLWSHIRMFLLPKVRILVSWESYRGICLLDVLSNMFMAGIRVMIREWEHQFLGAEWRSPLLFGFEAECHCEDISMCVQSGVSAAAE